jgi:hypothetical protein
MLSLIMALHLILRDKCFLTHITAIWKITAVAVYALMMLVQTTPTTVGLVTHTARERTLSSMQALMFLQITLIIE